MRSSALSKLACGLAAGLILSAAARAQEPIKPCVCVPCGGQVECEKGSTGWCECRSNKCHGGCLRNDRDPRRLAASVLTVIVGEGGQIQPAALQENGPQYAGILKLLLSKQDDEQTYRIEYGPRKIRFVLTAEMASQLGAVAYELQGVAHTGTPSPTPTPKGPDGERQTSFVEAINSNGWVGLLVSGLLFAMWLYFIVVTPQSFMTFAAAERQSRELALRVGKALRDDRIEDVGELSLRFRNSHLARVVNAILQEFLRREASADVPGDEAEANRRVVENAVAVASVELTQGLSGLATVSRVAPWVGLFGLTYGFIFSLASSESPYALTSRPQFVGGLYLAAFGIFIGVGAKLAHTQLSDKVNHLVAEMKNVGGEIAESLLKKRTRRLAT
ncbi:MAG TPA: MotA/TolQ/ExbB proton channel family protein [Pyrinomonadaceae bacterium]|jgi:biopolymer transport protein ExbB/TolQ